MQNHPQTQGLVKNLIFTQSNLFSMYWCRKMNEWDFYLDEVLEAYNSNCYKATGFSVSDLLLSPFSQSCTSLLQFRNGNVAQLCFVGY